MKLVGTALELTATDLSNFLGCRYRTALEMGVAHGKHARPFRNDPLLDILMKRGLEHERAHVETLRPTAPHIVDLRDIKDTDAAAARSLEGMHAGADLIVQAGLSDGRWSGRADVLRRVSVPSSLGAWSYEVVDTKLAQETRGGTILQLGLYSELLGVAQGRMPEFFHVVTPGPDGVHTYRTDDYAAYFRQVRAQMVAIVAKGDELVAAAYYPEPVEHCEVCPWYAGCNAKRHDDDHPSIVAGISRLQRRELGGHGVTTLTALARLPLPLALKPKRGALETYLRVREQARLQLDSRGRERPLHELRALEEGKGLGRLPEPSPGDIFLDLEGDAFAREGGREYLFGVVTLDPAGAPAYRPYWALTDEEERTAFESVMDLIAESWQAHPGMHVYHYAPYEPSAFKRLMGRYATREEELDTLLRAERFVDLYGVVRQGLLAGIERYSIKNLEVFYAYTRAVSLAQARGSLLRMEQALELNCAATVAPEVRALVQGYNQDDCLSTLHLREWLEGLRAALERSGTTVPRPVAQQGEASEEVDARGQRVATLRGRLLEGIPDARADRSPEQHARWLLAYLLDWHRREDKAGWWEYYRLRDLPEEDLFDEPHALAGMEFVERIGFVPHKTTGNPTKTVVDRYRYPAQEAEIRRGDELKLTDGKFGDVETIDRTRLTVDVKKGPRRADEHPTSVFAHKYIPPTALEDALYRLGESVAASGVVTAAKSQANPLAGHLLLGATPRLRSGTIGAAPGETAVQVAVRVVGDLDRTVLAIQGPPGSGKTWSGAEMICALVVQGRKVGVTATSHKVIENLLLAVAKAANEKRVVVRLAQKSDEAKGAIPPIASLSGNDEPLAALQSRTADVVGGTPWLWAREEYAQSVDVLFVDEAGQVSLANVLAASGAAGSIVLLGDPQQLDQPRKGSHPEGVAASALEHLIGDHPTIPPERGLFLPETWRLAPSICDFTSELFYDGKLRSKAGLKYQRLLGADGLEGSGLWVVEASHEGNRNSSMEEVEMISGLVERLIAPGSRWVDEDEVATQMKGEDILVVSPYNAQVVRLTERLEGTGVQVGTVDKFQGREAPVVIYSMATSRPEDAPRGMEFLYSLNRLNVATSRARCAVFLVASPHLYEPECRSPRQMELANALCRFREMAEVQALARASPERRNGQAVVRA